MTVQRLLLLTSAFSLTTVLACGDKDPGDDDGGGDGDDTGSEPIDADEDGFTADVDCDDSDPAVNPDADETCNGIDDDCDDEIDEDAIDTATFYADSDDDGYGDVGATTTACDAPTGYVTDDTDCDDTVATTFPGADETCNEVDDDCDTEVDEDAIDASTWYADTDTDEFGDPADAATACTQPEGYVADDTDCDDTDGSVFPGAVEICNGVDDDCDSTTTEAGTATWWNADGEASDVTDLLAGTVDTPAEFLIDEEGTLQICDGTWYANIDALYSATVQSQSGDPTTTVLDGGDTDSVLTLQGGGNELTVTGLTLTGGNGGLSEVFGSTGFGGGIYCDGYDAEDPEAIAGLTLTDVVIEGNYADIYGGGIMGLQCDLTATSTVIQDNEAGSASGGILLYGGDSTLTDVDISGNVSGYEIGGAFFLTLWGDSFTHTFEGVRVTDNEAAIVGGIGWAYADVTWTAGETGSAVTGNIADEFVGGALVNPYAIASFEEVDFGTDEDGTDNDVNDVVTGSRGAFYRAPDAATFDCDEEYCGEPVTTVLGSDEYSETRDVVGLMLAQADGWYTIESFSLYAQAPDAGCYVDFYVLSNDSLAEDGWAIEWSSTGNYVAGGPIMASVGDVGIVTEPDIYYALGAGTDCDDELTYWYDYSATYGSTDVGFGTMEGVMAIPNYELVDEDSTFFVTTEGDGTYYMEIDVTEL